MFLEEILNKYTIFETQEDYGQKLNFDYKKIRGGKRILSYPKPVVFYLGTWRMTDKKGNNKKFICGINLAYLNSNTEIVELQKALPDILRSTSMKSRYRIGKSLLPDIFEKAYRTYNVDNIATRPIYGRLYALKPTKDDTAEAKKIASKDGFEWSDLNTQEKNQYIDQAIRKRGKYDINKDKETLKTREKVAPDLHDKFKTFIEPEVKAEPKKPEVKTEPEQPEVKIEPKKPEVKIEPEQPEVKVEPEQPEVKVEPKKPEVKAEPKKPEVKAEPKKPEVKAEPKKPEVVAAPVKIGKDVEPAFKQVGLGQEYEDALNYSGVSDIVSKLQSDNVNSGLPNYKHIKIEKPTLEPDLTRDGDHDESGPMRSELP